RARLACCRRRARSPSSRWRNCPRPACRARPPERQRRRPIASHPHELQSPSPRARARPRPPALPVARPTTRLARRAEEPRRRPLRSLWKLREVRLALLHVGVATFLRLFAHVIEESRVARELLDAGEAVVGRIEAGLEHAQRERAELEHAAAPGHGFLFQVSERDDLVDESHVEGLL